MRMISDSRYLQYEYDKNNNNFKVVRQVLKKKGGLMESKEYIKLHSSLNLKMA